MCGGVDHRRYQALDGLRVGDADRVTEGDLVGSRTGEGGGEVCDVLKRHGPVDRITEGDRNCDRGAPIRGFRSRYKRGGLGVAHRCRGTTVLLGVTVCCVGDDVDLVEIALEGAVEPAVVEYQTDRGERPFLERLADLLRSGHLRNALGMGE